MADADEDVIPPTSVSGPDDLEDETQDFRFLSQLTSSSKTGQAIVPKRGTKDFEPNPTRSQASALDASRLAMHTALSAVRIQTGKNHVVGQYLPNEDDWRWDGDGSEGRHGRCVVVYKFKSPHLKVMGQADRNNWVWLLPEEALFLLERGNLDIRWPDVKTEDGDGTPSGSEDRAYSIPASEEDPDAQEPRTLEPEKEVDVATNPSVEPSLGELPMSLQGAYASFIGKDGLTLERYTVYSGLKRAGYIVQRAPTWNDTDLPQANGHGHHGLSPLISPLAPSTPASGRSQSPGTVASLVHKLVSWLFQPHQGSYCSSLGPLVAPGLYRNYADIFRALALIPYHEPSSANTTELSDSVSSPRPRAPQAPYRIHFHVWKPNVSATYKKTSPPPEDYRICVVDARSTPSIPSLSEIGPLLDSQPEDSLSKAQAGRLEARLKHGRRNVLLAVVDMGVVSYLRLSDACFGADKLYEEKTKAGTKGRPRRTQGQGQSRGQGQGRK
ncbi:uncharacterized protein PV07_00651 [Cladophialophora immunda]|uniref:tRNA-splicing endonuclease subunit Sen54 N-terminal domain-containing protein n=1 Tax=Cladophialophora immunda TaxID=569365 RepID=A0A0D2B870_9EURO|nr:uncharacterized protein PV07_00651 [Cladophialophora immunda]KIW33832.1 hypothetical protein PV07_00651 [Cladophialophora immunda]OQU94347.1 hypothetical protein CLAIMM_00708 [Cladophialophora immunda]